MVKERKRDRERKRVRLGFITTYHVLTSLTRSENVIPYLSHGTWVGGGYMHFCFMSHLFKDMRVFMVERSFPN